jgi:hypothetical protein
LERIGRAGYFLGIEQFDKGRHTGKSYRRVDQIIGRAK